MINIFDFDGVLASPIEDGVFRLPADIVRDRVFNRLGIQRYNVGRLCDHVQRTRHMVLQEVLYERGIPCASGPKFDLMNREDPFFVLTARSSAGAVARVSKFFEFHARRPEEIFFVGPMSKAHVLTALSERFASDKLTFFDDTMHHILEADKLKLPNITVEFVDNNLDTLTTVIDQFYTEQFNWLISNQT